MLQFTKQEVECLQERSRKQQSVVIHLKENIREIMEGEILVPKTGIANWRHYYYCSKCSVALVFDRRDRFHHRCPSCGTIYTGEPYDSTWWGFVNAKNEEAVVAMAFIYQMTGELPFAKKALEIMLEYAKYYKGYEVHGDIPYNDPGKAHPQTLDESIFLRSFANVYDLLGNLMTLEERTFVKEELLIPGAEFLMEHRHNQLHNHEVITNSAIAIIGLIFDLDPYINFALYEPYGLLYQLEKGVLLNHMWFEGGFGYHFYALESFFAYEKFALHTPHSHIKHPNYKAMLELLTDYLEPEFGIPMLNDTNFEHLRESLYLYEFPYRELGGEKLLSVLDWFYRERKRNNFEALIYGVDSLGVCPDLAFVNYHVDIGESGCVVLRGDQERYLLLKQDAYGGEHDHYDRLGISYLAFGKRISTDLGTTGYGAELHYGYFKNTGTHNTVNIGEENQAPVNARLTKYEEKDGFVYVEAEADWTLPYEMPDSFTIVQWKEENYRTVKMRRKIIWAKHYFVEAFFVSGVPEGLNADWVMHFSGERMESPKGISVADFSEKKPYSYLNSMEKAIDVSNEAEGGAKQLHFVYVDGDVRTRIYSLAEKKEIYFGKGPDNPSTREINYQIERAYGSEVVFAHVISSDDGNDGLNGTGGIGSVSISQTDEGIQVSVGNIIHTL